MRTAIHGRYLASLIHLGISLSVFSLFLFILLQLWYPDPFFSASGGWQGLRLVALVDLVLGPLLTFIVYSATKPQKELRNDLSFIVIVQLMALSWGIHTVYQQRPIAIAFWETHFYTVPFAAVSDQYKNSPALNLLIEKPLQFVYVKKPTAIESITSLVQEVKEKQLPPFQLVERFLSFTEHFSEIKKHSIDIHEIITSNPRMNDDLQDVLDLTGTKIQDNIYIPLVSKYQNIILVFSQKGQQLGFIKSPLKTSVT